MVLPARKLDPANNSSPPPFISTPSNNEDLKLIKSFLETKSQIPFEVLLTKYKSKIRSCVYLILKNTQDVDDVFQLVAIRLFKKLNLFKGESKFSSWLFRLVQNEALMFLRKKKSPKQQIIDPGLDDFDSYSLNRRTDITPERICSAKEQVKKLFAKADCYKEIKAFKAFLDVYADNLTTTIAAKKYKRTVPAIKSQIHRIRCNFKRLDKIINSIPFTQNDFIRAMENQKMIVAANQFNKKVSELKKQEAQMIAETLSKTGNNKTEAAKLLGLKRSTLLMKIKKLNQLSPNFPDADTSAIALIPSEPVTPKEHADTRKILRAEIRKLELQLSRLHELERHYEAMDYIKELEISDPDKAFDLKLEETKRGYNVSLS